MTDIVERLKEYAEDDHERGCQGRYYDCSCGYDGKRDPLLSDAADEIERLKAEVSALNHAEVKLLVQVDEQDAEIERLKVQNIQMQAALGYAICAGDERHIIPENPFRCGVCDANKGIHAEIERLRAALALAEYERDGGVTLEQLKEELSQEPSTALKEDGDE